METVNDSISGLAIWLCPREHSPQTACDMSLWLTGTNLLPDLYVVVVLPFK